MCVYPLTVPISSLSISLPPGSWPICLPGLRAWSHRSGPCQPRWNISVCVWIGGWACERMRVCASICYNRGASCDRSPLTSALGEGACSCICGLLLLQTTDVACVRMHPPMIMYRFLCLHEAPYVCVYLSKKCLTPVLWRHPSPSFLPVIFFGTRWGARVTSDPLLHCDWRDRPDSPPPCYCTLMGIWHYSHPFINRATTTHLSFPSSLISVPISVIL